MIVSSDKSDKQKFVFKADNCENTDCPQTNAADGSLVPLKLFSIWRGSKISELLAPAELVDGKWNILRSMMFNLQYELETAKVRHFLFFDFCKFDCAMHFQSALCK